jgi:phage FluMu protein Com
MRQEARCPKCKKLLFIITSLDTKVKGIEIKCTRCKNIAIYLDSHDSALTVTQ